VRAVWGAVLALCAALSAGCAAVPATALPPPMDEGDIVYSGFGPGEAGNLDRFDAFLAVAASGGEDAVRIVSYTVEGAPIYTDVTYEEGKYIVYVDASEDGSAADEDRGRRKAAECAELQVSDRPDEFGAYMCGDYTFVVADIQE